MKKNTTQETTVVEKNSPAEQSSSEEHAIRQQKVEQMRALGIEPWPGFKEVTATAKEVHDEFKDDDETRQYAVAGRIMSLREHGKSAFANIQDRTGTLQVYVQQDGVGEEAFAQFIKFADIGDIVWFYGRSFKTRSGEITLKVEQFTILSKCLHPIPSSFYGLSDVETKYRQRYLDLTIDAKDRERFIKRSQITKLIRQFLDSHSFMEVETPMLQPIPGGAAARPFITHHNTLDIDLYLRIAPELYLKRLIVGGLERIYEINRNFRNEGISTKHNPEFTMVEFYVAHQDYVWAMELVEKMLRFVAQEVNNNCLQVTFGDKKIDFAKPFVRMSMADAVKKYAKCSDDDLREGAIDDLLRTHQISLEKNAPWGKKLFVLFDQLVEPNLEQPTFITQFPVAVSPLAKRNANDPRLVDRFELFVAGMELGNAFNELNDPIDQAERFREQARALSGGDVEAHHYDADFVQALEYALPPTVGFGMGIDRLAMLLTGTTSIKDVILFPTLKPKD